MAENKRSNLGRGLSALLGDDAGKETGATVKGPGPRQVPVERLHPGRYQPRHAIDEERIEELAQSVRENGIIQPLLVRRHPEHPDGFEIIAGERRWRAAQMAKLHEIPVVVKDLSDQESLEIALVENLQRQDLSPLEEADGYQRLVDEFAHTQDVLAKTVGKSRSHVANMMRLLGLPDPVKKMLDANELTAGHARALLGAPDPVDAARQVVKKGLNVRQTERLVKKQRRRTAAPPAPAKKDADTQALERDLANLLGLRVAIKVKGDGGSLIVHYDSLEQLDDILHRLRHGGAAGPAPGGPAANKAAQPDRAGREKRPKLSVGMRAIGGKRKRG